MYLPANADRTVCSLGIIAKDKKNLRWVGFPTNAQQESVALQQKRAEVEESIAKKREQIKDLILQVVPWLLSCVTVYYVNPPCGEFFGRQYNCVRVSQQICFKKLLERNQSRPLPPESARMQLPFIVVSTDKDTMIECQMADNKCVASGYYISSLILMCYYV